MATVPTTVEFPQPLPARRRGRHWLVEVDGTELTLSNLDKPFWDPEGYTKGDVVAYYANMAPHVLPYVRDRPLTLKRMPDGADGPHFYAKQAPPSTPDWVARAPITSRETGKTIDYLLAQDRRALVWLANLGCIELHAWHSRVDDLGHPDYALFDLDPMSTGFAPVREVALLVHTALQRLGLRGYPRTSGATGVQVYVPIERVHSAARVREWVRRVCQLIHRADPRHTTMEWPVDRRGGKVFLDHNMNTEGRNIATVYSLRPERGATVSTPLTWEELEGDVEPGDFTITSIWRRLDEVGDLFAPVLRGGQDLRAAMEAVDMAAESPEDRTRDHDVGEIAGPERRLERYAAKRDFDRTPEPRGVSDPRRIRQSIRHTPGRHTPGGRFVVQHHLATRHHHDLRLERDGVAVSWALPKGLPDEPGVRHLAVRTEDHPLEYLEFEGDIPEGTYGAGPMRIWDQGVYEPLEWRDDKVSVHLEGNRHHGEWHLFRVGGPDEPDTWNIVRTGAPVEGEAPVEPPAFAPMLATLAERPFDDERWLFEVKWDGVRVLASLVRPGAGGDGRTRLVSRLGNDVSDGYPELASLWERVLARDAVLDGEIVALDERGNPSFQRLQRRMHLRGPALERLRRQVPVTFVAFDLLWLDGTALVNLPLEQRLARLEEVLVPGGGVQRSVPIPRDGVALYEAARARGLEGVIAKHLGSRYLPGRRSHEWRKLKVRHQVVCVIGGWLPGEGSRAVLGSLLLGRWQDDRLRYVGKVGSGLDDAELERLRELLHQGETAQRPFARTAPGPPRGARWVRPELACAVEFTEVTEGGQLRAPVYKGLRDDVDVRALRWDDLVLSS